MQRNQHLEADGLFFESDTHEWFKDKSLTQHAQHPDDAGVKLPHIFTFIIRNKQTGEYERVLFDNTIREVIYADTSLEAVAVRIDMMKAKIQFDGNV